MRYTSFPQLDQQMRLGNNGEYTMRKIAVPVPGEALTLDGLFCTPNRRSGYYYAVEHPKHRVVVHFTAGNTRSDLNALTRQDYHVSVAFVIGTDGTIYQLFSSKYWSGHIGKGIGNINTGNAQDKVTIGIELSNYGYLTERQGNLETYYSRLNGGPVDVYCSLADRLAYQKLNTPFRGQYYFATHTDGQYQSLIVLLRYLTKVYNIPRQFLPEPKRYEATNDVLNFRGIVTHVNYRDSGKWDIGPAFDWNKVIQGVQAQQFTPTIKPVAKSMATKGPVLQSEKDLEPFLPQAKSADLQHLDYQDRELTQEPEMAGREESTVDRTQRTASAARRPSARKKTAGKKRAAKKAAAKKSSAKKTGVKKTASKKTGAKKTAVKKTTAKKTKKATKPARKAAAKKKTARKR